MSAGFTRVLDEAPWGASHWRIFAVASMNYFLNGVMFSIAPLLAYIVAKDIAVYVLMANLLSETAGALLLGRLADIYGRRRLFMLSLSIEVIALLALYFTYTNPLLFLIFTSAMTFGVGGEFGAVYAMLAELSPRRHRGKAVLLSTNFWNVGAAATAALLLAASRIAEDPLSQARLLLLVSIMTAAVIGIARLSLPESVRWLIIAGRRDEARKVLKEFSGVEAELELELPKEQMVRPEAAVSRYKFRISVFAVVTIVQYVTYGMLAYYAPYAPGFSFGVEEAPKIVLTANLGASIGAFLLIPLIDRARRLSLLLSFLGGSATALLVYLFHDLGSYAPFMVALFANLIFSEWAWGSISALKGELFPTASRASIVGLLVSLTGLSGALVVYSQEFITASQFITLTFVLWLAGLAASAVWYARGVESAGRSLEELS